VPKRLGGEVWKAQHLQLVFQAGSKGGKNMVTILEK
jgi:hypothetical protein